jgi:hypothetical protein
MSYTLNWFDRTITGYTGTLPAILDLSAELNPTNETALAIGANAFQNNLDLVSVIFGNDLLEIRDEAFRQNSNLNFVSFGNSLSSIGYQAFFDGGIKGVQLPNNINYISSNAFFGNQISSIVLPNSLTNIGQACFTQNNISTVTFGTGLSTITFGAFTNNVITGLTIPSNISVIGSNAFATNHLSNLTIPDTVQSIENDAFANNSTLTNVTFGTGLSSIAGSCFAGCVLKSLSLPNNITRIEPAAFYRNFISSVVFPNSITEILDGAFEQNHTLSSISIGTGLSTIDGSVFNSTNLTSLTIPENIKEINQYAFTGIPLLSFVTVNNFSENIIVDPEAFEPGVSIFYAFDLPTFPQIIARPIVGPTSLTFTVNSNSSSIFVSSLNIEITGPGGGNFGFAPPPAGWYRYTVSGLTTGCNYESYAYYNKSNAISSLSATFRSVYTGDKPSEVQNLTGNIVGTDVAFEWTAPSSDGSAPLLGYMIRDLVQLSNYNVPAWITSYTAPLLAPGANLFSLEAVNDPGYSPRVYWSTVTV